MKHTSTNILNTSFQNISRWRIEECLQFVCQYETETRNRSPVSLWHWL